MTETPELHFPDTLDVDTVYGAWITVSGPDGPLKDVVFADRVAGYAMVETGRIIDDVFEHARVEGPITFGLREVAPLTVRTWFEIPLGERG